MKEKIKQAMEEREKQEKLVAELGLEVEIMRGRRGIRDLKERFYAERRALLGLKDFIDIHTIGRVCLGKDEYKLFSWNPDKHAEGWGGFEFGGYLMDGDFYSLWVYADEDRTKNSPVIFNPENPRFLATTRKNKPLEIVSAAENGLHIPENKLMKILGRSKICTSYGVPIMGEQCENAMDLFERVQRGQKIAPKVYAPNDRINMADLRKVFGEEQERQKREKPEIVMRTEGQVFLQSLNPDEMIDGQVLGSGNVGKAFVFGDKVVVESDMPDHASYFFNKAGVYHLRDHSRTQLRTVKPEGYRGVTAHLGNWEERVLRFLVE